MKGHIGDNDFQFSAWGQRNEMRDYGLKEWTFSRFFARIKGTRKLLSSCLRHTKGKMTKFHLEMIHVGSSQHQILGESSGLDREIPAMSDGWNYGSWLGLEGRNRKKVKGRNLGKPSFRLGEKVMTAFQEQFEETERLIWRVRAPEKRDLLHSRILLMIF